MNSRCLLRLSLIFGLLLTICDANAEAAPHWSQSEPFGHNVPRDLKTDTLDDVRDRLADLQTRFGDRFTPAPLIDKLARRSGRFHHGGESSN